MNYLLYTCLRFNDRLTYNWSIEWITSQIKHFKSIIFWFPPISHGNIAIDRNSIWFNDKIFTALGPLHADLSFTGGLNTLLIFERNWFRNNRNYRVSFSKESCWLRAVSRWNSDNLSKNCVYNQMLRGAYSFRVDKMWLVSVIICIYKPWGHQHVKLIGRHH